MRKLTFLGFLTLVGLLAYAIHALASYEGPGGSAFVDPPRKSDRIIELRFKKVGSFPWTIKNFDGTMYKWSLGEGGPSFGFVTDLGVGRQDHVSILVYRLERGPLAAGYERQVFLEQIEAGIGEVALTIGTGSTVFAIEVLGVRRLANASSPVGGR